MTDPLIGSTTAVFDITLSVALTEPVDVAWSTKDGTAIAGTDYEAANGVVTFLPGETSKQIQVTVYGQDVGANQPKNFYITLTPPSNAILNTPLVECIITVEDDQGTPITSLVVAQGKRGLKGDPGLSAYEQAVIMGYTGTIEDWMNDIANAALAADRAEDALVEVEANAAKAEAAASAAAFAGRIFQTPAAGVDPITGVPNGYFYNVRSRSNDAYIDEYQNVDGVPTATGKSFPSSQFVQTISDYTALPFVAGKAYVINQRVQLANGDIVKSTINGNTNNPNVNMTWWLNVGNTGEVKSVADLTAIQNPKNGSRVFVKSYHAGLNKGGGTFVYNSAKSLINDGVVCFNGWVRQLESNKITTAMSGFTDNSANAVDSIRKCLAYLKTVGGGEIELTDGLYLLDAASLIKDPTPNQSNYRYWFEPVSNVTIRGSRNAVWKVADGVVAEDALYKYAKGYQVFYDTNGSGHENFKIKGFTFNGNAANNLLIPLESNPFGNQSQCQFTFFEKAIGFEASDLKIHNTSGHQIFCFRRGCSGHSVHHCEFLENGNINGNVNLTDHSSIYNEADDYAFYRNSFKNATFDTVSTAIETHGFHGVVYDNSIKNYNLAFIRAAMRSDSSNVLIFGNTAEGVTAGLMYDAAAGYSLETSDFSNSFEMRPAANTGTRTLCAINTGGQFADGTLGNHKVNTYNNKFTTANPNEGIAIIAGKVPEFTSKNEFVGFSIYVQHGSSQYPVNKVVLQDKLDLAGSTIDSLINIFNWDGNISNRHLILDGNIDLMSTIAALKYAVKCDLATLSVSGEIKGSFGANNVFPFSGAWGTNTLTFDYSCDSFVRPAYVLQGSITARIQTKSATYEKFVGSSNLVSKRYAFSAPTSAQTGGDYQGDTVYATTPDVCIGWVYTSTNVWKPFGVIS